MLGEGEFGAVYQGVYKSVPHNEEPVAIKTLRDSYNNAPREEFLREARLMMTLNHHCIVKLIGFSDGPPLLMVMINFSIINYNFSINDQIQRMQRLI